VVLEVTARNEKGEEIFSAEHEYEMIGLNQEGKRVFDAWAIRQINDDNTLQPDRIDSKTFEIPIPKEVESVSLEAVLSYLIAPEAQPIFMSKATKTIILRK
jgi:hypothetical protein